MNLNLSLALTLSAVLPMLSSCNGLRNGMYSPGSSSSSIHHPIVMDDSHPSLNYNERNLNPISEIVMHYTVANLEGSLQILTDTSRPARVSAHYVVPETAIDNQRKVYQLVPNDKRAWHAGVGQWGACNDVNSTSIGIEIVNSGYKDVGGKRTYVPFPDYQIDTVMSLTQPMVETYGIQPTNVIGHADLAPGRKQDPGPAFPWEKLYKNGIGAWYDRSELDVKEQGGVDIEQLQKDLKSYGYPVKQLSGVLDEDTRNVLTSFQMHFRPSNYSGDADAETAAIAKNLVEKYYND